jgi:hypothetical protein
VRGRSPCLQGDVLTGGSDRPRRPDLRHAELRCERPFEETVVLGVGSKAPRSITHGETTALDNRELATLILVAAATLAVFVLSGTRGAAISVLNALKGRLLFILVLYVGWLGAVIWTAASLQVWSTRVWAATLLWFIFAGLSLFFSFNKISKDPTMLRQRVFATLSLGATFEFFLNLQTFPLWAELPLQLALIAIAVMYAFASTNVEYLPAKRLLGGILAIATAMLVLNTVVKLVQNWKVLDKTALWQDSFFQSG